MPTLKELLGAAQKIDERIAAGKRGATPARSPKQKSREQKTKHAQQQSE